MEKVIIFGLGDIAEIAHLYLSESGKYQVVAFTVDKEYMKQNEFKGLPVVAFEDVQKIYPPDEYKMFIAIGYTKVNQLRAEKYYQAKEKGYEFISYISPKAFVASNAKIGENCFIFEDNTIQPFVTIEDNCILWSGNHIGHHSIIRSHCFIASHVVISGRCEIGEYTFIGVNATLRDNVKIGKSNVIGAGALIMKDTNDNEVYVAKPTELFRLKSSQLRGI